MGMGEETEVIGVADGGKGERPHFFHPSIKAQLDSELSAGASGIALADLTAEVANLIVR